MSQKCFKFAFIAQVSTLKLNLKFACSLSVIWKRGDKLAEVKQRQQIVNGVATFNQQLSIDCNMIFNTETKLFESKKTLFSILIFTDKGTKQAGQIEVDVAQLLNNKQQQKAYQCSLLKCPDKNAKLSFKISPSFKQQIRPDAVSQRSLKTVDVQKVAGTINISQANFKKKPKASDQQKNPIPYGSKNSQTQIPLSPQQIKQLKQQNKKLKQQSRESKKQVDKIKKSIENSQKTIEQQKAKCQSYQKEIARLKIVSKAFNDIEVENKMLQNQVLICKLKLAQIFNKAFEIGGPSLADRLQEACGYRQNQSS